MRYTFSVTNTAGSAVDDLTLTFDSDLNSGNTAMEIGNSPNFTGIEGPASWGPVSFVDRSQGVVMGAMTLATGQAMSFPIRRILAQVLGQAIGTTISARAVLHSASYGITLSRSVDSFILGEAPPPAFQPAATATPLAGEGQMLCYPQPAHDRLCFAYQARAGKGGRLSIKIYNIAAQLVAEIQDSSSGGSLETSCADISGIAPGVYFYRATLAGFSFPTGEFGIVR